MIHDPFAEAFVLTGPTGSGKSAVALDLAERLGGEIVAMDSMTLYRGLDIGTAKPSLEEQLRVRHHAIDVLDPWESANVAWWLARAAAACADIRARGKRPLLVGGTPLYLKAVLSGLFDAPPTNPELRTRLESDAERLGPIAFHRRLAAIDPPTAARLHPNDIRRVVRALEVWELTGQPISALQQTWETATFAGRSPGSTIPCAVLEWPRDELVRRIETRVDTMLAGGWLDEVRRLRELPRPLSKEASQALGYKELFAHSPDTEPPRPETVTAIKTRTRQFAKRQLTWFRSLPGCRACAANEPNVADRVRILWENANLTIPAQPS